MSTTSMPSNFQSPAPTNWSETQIGRAAEEIAEKLGYKPGCDIKAFVENELGGTVEVDDWRNPAPSGEIQVRGPGKFTIWLSPYTAPARNVFTIAHELGHYFLHSKIGRIPIEVRREGNNRIEWEANCFAASFLLPGQAFRNAWSLNEGNIDMIAAEFGVSTSVVSIRAERLKLA